MSVPDSASVRPENLVNGVQVMIVIIGVAITIPAFLVGGQLVEGLGIRRAAIAISVGAAAVAAIASLTMTLAVRTRWTTYQIVSQPFGELGGKVVSLVMATSLLGWFGVTAALFGQALGAAVLTVTGVDLPAWSMTLTGSALMIVTTLYGFSAIERLSRFVVPLLCVLLVVAAWKSLVLLSAGPAEAAATAPAGLRTIGAGISVVISAYMVAVTIAPDIARFIKTRPQAVAAAVGGYGVGYGGVLLLAGIPALLAVEGGYIAQLVMLGLGVPALLLVVLATWTTNCSNLYSASLGYDSVIKPRAYKPVVLALGAAGTLAGLLGIADNLVPYLVVLSIAIPPISGIYLTHYLVPSRAPVSDQSGFRLAALVAWVVATALAWFGAQGAIQLTGVPSLDSFLAAALAYAMLARISAATTTD